MFLTISNENIGSVSFTKLEDFNRGDPQRASSSHKTLTGETVHQVTQTQETDREITGTIEVDRTNRNTLISINESSTYFIHTLQTDENAYKGYLSIIDAGQPSPNCFRFTFTFKVTEKLT